MGEPAHRPARPSTPARRTGQAQRRGELQRASEIPYGEIRPWPTAAATREAEGEKAPSAPRWSTPPDRRRRHPLDRHPVEQLLRGRAREAAAHGGRAPEARGRPGPGPDGRRRRRAPQPRRPERSEQADRLVPVPGPHRRRQDRAHQGARRVPLRRRGGHHPHRHERVHGEALGQPDHRRAPGLRRLRRGRPLTEAIRRRPYR